MPRIHGVGAITGVLEVDAPVTASATRMLRQYQHSFAPQNWQRMDAPFAKRKLAAHGRPSYSGAKHGCFAAPWTHLRTERKITAIRDPKTITHCAIALHSLVHFTTVRHRRCHSELGTFPALVFPHARPGAALCCTTKPKDVPHKNTNTHNI